MFFKKIFFVMGALGALSLASACSSGTTAGSSQAPLVPSCTEDAGGLDPADWLCPNDLTVECKDGVGDPATIYLEPSGDLSETPCENIELSLNDEGPFAVGTHDIVVTAQASSEGQEPTVVECQSTLTVTDTEPPEARNEPIELWPPNHKFHTISGEDCVKDACDGELNVTFLSASSDEPVNDKGDGNTEPDIILGCDSVELRAERQGGSDGRVYTLEYRAVDDAGNETSGTCTVVVPHDQSGREAIAQDPAYTIDQANECNDGTGGTGGNGGEGGMGGEAGHGGEGGMGGEAGHGGEGGMGGEAGHGGEGGMGGIEVS